MRRLALIAALAAASIVAVVVQLGRGDSAGFGLGSHSHRGDTTISILPGLPGITIHGDPLYAEDDPWRRYLAPESRVRRRRAARRAARRPGRQRWCASSTTREPGAD